MPRWREAVPVLSGGDIIKNKVADCNGRHCLTGWIGETFRPVAHVVKAEAEIIAAAEHLRLAGSGFGGVISINDNSRNSTRMIARVWNLAMAVLGYTVGNPETKEARKLLKARAKGGARLIERRSHGR